MPKKTKNAQKEIAASKGTAANGKDEFVPSASGRARKGVVKKEALTKQRSARKGPARKSDAPPPVSNAPSDWQIRLRAYFLAEKRARLSLPGDKNSDWLEAKRQLLEEAGLRPN